MSDINREISRAYGCLITEGEERGVALRATFIINPKGILKHFSFNSLGVGRNVDEIIRLVKAF